ncbi:hypothetical protein YC2023_060447 [Brassica napus]
MERCYNKGEAQMVLKHPQAFHHGGEFRRVIAIREEEEVRIQVATLRTTPHHLKQGSKPNKADTKGISKWDSKHVKSRLSWLLRGFTCLDRL